MDPLTTARTRFLQTVSIFFWVLCLVAVASFFFILRANKSIDTSSHQTISVDGKAERYVAPDIARINFTESQKANTAAAAQEIATKKINEVMDFLNESGIEEKDIKTTSYQIYPVYEYYWWNENTATRCYNTYSYPCVQKENITGYRVEQSVEVKVRDIEKVGGIIAGIGSKGIQNISGLSLEVEDYERIAEEVKNEAIKDARNKAKERAKSLGVSLGDIVGVSDGGYMPYYYGRGGEMMETKAMALNADSAPVPSIAPTISTGENKIEATVNVTYEIN